MVCKLSRNRHGKMESRTLSNRAFHPDSSAMRFRDMPRDGKSQPGAAHFARAPFVYAIKSLEDAFLLGMWNANSIVGYGEYDFAVVSRRAHDNLPARRRILHRVIQQILQYVSQTSRISAHCR